MIGLGDKLARFMTQPTTPVVAPEVPARITPRLDFDRLPRPRNSISTIAHAPLEGALPGQVMKTRVGATWVASTLHSPPSATVTCRWGPLWRRTSGTSSA